MDYTDGAGYFPIEYKLNLFQEKVAALESRVTQLENFIKEVKNYVDEQDYIDWDRFVEICNDFDVRM